MATISRDDYWVKNLFFPYNWYLEEVNGSIADSSWTYLEEFTSSDRTDVPAIGAPTLTIAGEINDNADLDFYEIEVTQEDLGIALNFDVDGTTNGLDAMIVVYDANGVAVHSNDDGYAGDAGSATNWDPYSSFTPQAAGKYYVEIRSYNAASSGAYTLHIGIAGAIGIQSYGNGTMAGDDLYGDRQGDVISDIIDGRAGNDRIQGDEASDKLIGGDGADSLYGGNGEDTLYGDGEFGWTVGGTTVYGGMYEGPGDEDLIYGGNDRDHIYAGRGNDKLFGEAGDDYLNGGDGSDRFDGGPGADFYERESPFVGGSNTFVLRKLQSTPLIFDTFDYGGPAGYASFNGAGVAGGDIIDLAGFGPVFWQGAVAFNTAISSAVPGAGNGVNDGLFFNVSSSLTWLFIDADDDGKVSGSDLLAKFDTAAATKLAVTLITPDDFKAKQVFAAEQGLATDESFTGLATTDYFKAGGGKDKVNGNGGIDRLLGESGNDRINGGDGNDSLDGGTENDTLTGGAGIDYILGGDGNDVLTGGAARDIMSGGAGIDRFDYNAIAETGTTAATRDTILDFVHGQDKIDLSTMDANPGGGTSNDTFVFLTTGGFTAPGQVRVLPAKGGLDALVRINTDADIDPEATILLTGVKAGTITGADFLL